MADRNLNCAHEPRRSRPSAAPFEDGLVDSVARDRARSALTAGERAEQRADEAIAVARSAEAKLDGVLDVLGRPPSPGVPGSGLVGAVMQMQRDLHRLLEDAGSDGQHPPTKSARRTTAIVALVATLLGGGGVTAFIQALRGGGPPSVDAAEPKPKPQ